MKRLALALCIALPLFAQIESVNDSLVQELESVKSKLEKLEYEKLLRQKSELERELGIEQPLYDTIITCDTVIKPRVSLTPAIPAQTEEKTEGRFSGGGGPSVGMVVLDLSPVKDMIANSVAMFGEDSPYYKLAVEESIVGTYENFFIVGGGGYAELGKGFRIGGAGYGAFRTYNFQDSDQRMGVTLGYGGAILEKAWYNKRSSVALGTLLGGGGYTTELRNPEGSSYPTVNSSGLFTGDIHASGSFKINSILRVGVELFALLLASQTGFETGDSFATFNGGGRIQLFFGSHGI